MYVHVPFCSGRCRYCDFPTVARPDLPHQAYADAVLRELAGAASCFAGGTLVSVYFGGGTPSRWAPAHMGRVLAAVRDLFPRRATALEVTVECSPTDLTVDLLDALAAIGVARMSVGVQSLHDGLLSDMGRRHCGAQARRALSLVRRATPEMDLSVDLMLGLPGQTRAGWLDDLQELRRWRPEHVSLYSLTVAPSTPLGIGVARGLERPASDDEAVEMLRTATRHLQPLGYQRYEVSNYALPGHQARHNSLYWEGKAYLGLGAGAHSFRPLHAGRSALRWANTTAVDAYMAAPGVGLATCELLDETDTARERLLCGLRLARGLNVEVHTRLGGHDPRTRSPGLVRALRAAGLLGDGDGATLRLTPAGLDVCDAVVLELAP